MALANAPVLLPSSPISEGLVYPDEPVQSVEEEFSDSEHRPLSRRSSGADEAVFDNGIDDDGHSSPGTSHSDDECISELPTDSRCPSYNIDREDSVVYTPKKQRSPFRNPSSVRALQLDTTPPHLRSSSSRNKYRLSNISRNSTPKSVRSVHGGSRSARSSPVKRTEHPLVLLHVTLLPVSSPYSQEIMEAVLPEYIIDNWKLLKEKAADTVLERGILINHPRDDYDLLEERLLEALELKVPRILQCGHFHLSPEEEEEILGSEGGYDSDDDGDKCDDCGRRIRDGSHGVGSGYRRWDIKVYASNGLMRAGAWSAAWREMERVDIEILPWLEGSMKRELELRKEEETAHVAAQAQAKAHFATPETPPSQRQPPAAVPAPTMTEERRREIYGEDAQASVDGFADATPPQPQSTRAPKAKKTQAQAEPPLSDLLANYLHLLMKDRRNLVIAALSILVIFFAFGMGKSSPPSQSLMPQPPIMSQAAYSSEPVQAYQPPVAAHAPAVASHQSAPVQPPAVKKASPSAQEQVHAQVYAQASEQPKAAPTEAEKDDLIAEAGSEEEDVVVDARLQETVTESADIPVEEEEATTNTASESVLEEVQDVLEG
jgi:hypothetical protein